MHQRRLAGVVLEQRVGARLEERARRVAVPVLARVHQRSLALRALFLQFFVFGLELDVGIGLRREQHADGRRLPHERAEHQRVEAVELHEVDDLLRDLVAADNRLDRLRVPIQRRALDCGHLVFGIVLRHVEVGVRLDEQLHRLRLARLGGEQQGVAVLRVERVDEVGGDAERLRLLQQLLDDLRRARLGRHVQCRRLRRRLALEGLRRRLGLPHLLAHLLELRVTRQFAAVEHKLGDACVLLTIFVRCDVLIGGDRPRDAEQADVPAAEDQVERARAGDVAREEPRRPGHLDFVQLSEAFLVAVQCGEVHRRRRLLVGGERVHLDLEEFAEDLDIAVRRRLAEQAPPPPSLTRSACAMVTTTSLSSFENGGR